MLNLTETRLQLTTFYSNTQTSEHIKFNHKPIIVKVSDSLNNIKYQSPYETGYKSNNGNQKFV